MEADQQPIITFWRFALRQAAIIKRFYLTFNIIQSKIKIVAQGSP